MKNLVLLKMYWGPTKLLQFWWLFSKHATIVSYIIMSSSITFLSINLMAQTAKEKATNNIQSSKDMKVNLDQEPKLQGLEKKILPQKQIKRTSKSPFPFDHSHSQWSDVLKNFLITNGNISHFNYKKLKTSPHLIDKYLTRLSQVTVDEYKIWTRNQQLAFLINAYNAFTIKLVLNHYPLTSIKEVGGFFSSPWKKKFFKLLGKKRHLDNLENTIILEKFGESRVHFVANSTAISCPKLKREAYQASQLDDQLEEQTRQFLSDRSQNNIDIEKKVLNLSKIFKWYGKDFSKKGSNIASFVAPYITNNPLIQNDIKAGLYSVNFLDFNWNLNEVK